MRTEAITDLCRVLKMDAAATFEMIDKIKAIEAGLIKEEK